MAKIYPKGMPKATNYSNETKYKADMDEYKMKGGTMMLPQGKHGKTIVEMMSGKLRKIA